MTNVNLVAEELYPQAGADNKGRKLGYINSGVKAAQNDTWTVTNASEVVQAFLQIDATGEAEENTLSTNIITLTSATTTPASGLIIFR